MERREPRHMVSPYAATKARSVEEHHGGSTRLAELPHMHCPLDPFSREDSLVAHTSCARVGDVLKRVLVVHRAWR